MSSTVELSRRDYAGGSPPRSDGPAKVRGLARYVDDIAIDGVLYGATLRTASAGGRLHAVTFADDIDWDAFIIVTAADIPGHNYVQMIENDQPVLVKDHFRHAGEAVLLIAHADRARLAEALAGITLVEVPDPTPVFDIDQALRTPVEAGQRRVFTDYRIDKGCLADGEAAADVVIEACFETGAQEHVYIEPQGMLAQLDADGVLRVEGSMQCPYYVLDALVTALARDKHRLRVVQHTTGGGFGGKEDYPSMIACHAALLALKAGGRPVKLIYGRAEDMAFTPKRHPSRSRVRLGASRDGRLRFIDMDFALNAGAYVTLSPVVLSRGLIHAPGPYRCEHLAIRARAVATSHPPFGAFRGFGAPQSIFALEAALDQLADALQLEPAELRRRNLLRAGDSSPTGAPVSAEVDVHRVLQQALEESDYANKRRAYVQWNQRPSPLKKGIGLVTFYHGSGFTGNGELALKSKAGLRADADGRIHILTSSTEIGQGMATTFAQIVAERLGLPLDWVGLAPSDTAQVPNSGPTVASRTCMVVGRIVQDAADQLLDRLRGEADLTQDYDSAAFAHACRRLIERHGELRVIAQYRPKPGLNWDEKTFQGAAYASFAWACYVADLEVDTTTYDVRLNDFVAVQEIGTAVHPIIAKGQIEGGVAQAIGWALYENVLWDEQGLMANPRITNYILPTSADTPPIRVFFQESNADAGPGGAKGIGELPMDGPAPAIVNALRQALGANIQRLPVLPEELMALTPPPCATGQCA